MGFVLPHKTLFVCTLLLALVSSLVALINPYLLKIFLDDVLINKKFHLFYVVAAAFLGVFFLTKALSLLENYLSMKFSQRVNLGVRTTLFHHLNSLDREFFHKHKTGDVITRFESDATSILAFVNIVFTSGLVSVFRAASIIAVSVTLSWQATTLALIVFPFYFLSERYFVKREKKGRKQIIKKSSDVRNFLHEKLPMVKTTQLFTRERQETTAFRKKNKARDLANLKMMLVNNISGSVTTLILYVPTYLILIVGGYQVLLGMITIGTLIALREYIQTLYGPLATLANLYRDVQMNSVSLTRVLEVLDREPKITTKPGAIKIPDVAGKIEFRNVTFAYEKGFPILRNISFAVKPGETVGIMGCSGEGKTTMNDLLCRLYDPQKGSVRLDDHDVRDLDVQWLRRQIGVVSQESVLADSTVRENILYGKPTATTVRVIAAAEDADAHEFVSKLPKSYSTRVKEAGKRLSGGQRQRLAIARVLLKNPAVVVFDEATSALDPQSEVRIREVIRRRFRHKTCLVISHRISTILDCDRILMLENGSIREEGSLQELLAKRGLFWKFYDSQISPLAEEKGLLVQ